MVLAVGECCSNVKSTRVLICLARTIVMLEVLLSLLPKSFARSMCFKGTDSSQLANDCLLKTWFKAHWQLLKSWLMLGFGSGYLGDVHPATGRQHEISMPSDFYFCGIQVLCWPKKCPMGHTLPFRDTLFSGLPASSRMQGNYWSQCWGPCVVSE